MLEKLFVIGFYLVVIGAPFIVIGAFLEWYFEKRGKQ
jgi:hypothetical protein